LIFLFGPISSMVLLGEWDAALARASEPTSGERLQEQLVFPLVIVHSARGDVASARGLLEAHAELKTSEDPQARGGYFFAAAHVLRAEGKPGEALSAAQEGLALIPEMGFTFLNVKECVIETLEAAFELGDRGRVEELLEMIESQRPGQRPPILEAHAHRFRAKLVGDESAFRTAVALFRELELRFDLAVTLLELAEATGDAQPREEAAAIFEQLGAVPWLERAGGVGTGVEVPA
jgi:hypothetical protein